MGGSACSSSSTSSMSVESWMKGHGILTGYC
ncbi:hypothetical protein LINGRAHAP2_LOCUS30125 [Linum grandiflorum]